MLRKNLTSLFLICGYIFYNFIVLYVEIFYFQNELDEFKFMVLIPLIYIVVHLVMERVKRCFIDLNKFFIMIVMIMCAISIIGYVVNDALNHDSLYVRMVFFIVNGILYQKLMFTQIIVYLLKMFDIGIIKLRNQMNGILPL